MGPDSLQVDCLINGMQTVVQIPCVATHCTAPNVTDSELGRVCKETVMA
jgi:hypothetical protein